MPNGSRSNLVGGSGGDYASRGDFRLLERMLRLGIEIPDVIRERGASYACNFLAANSKDARLRLRAFEALVMCERLNVQIAMKCLDKRFPDQIEVSDGEPKIATEVARELRKDPQYIAYARSKRRKATAGVNGNGNGNGNGHKSNGNGRKKK